VRCGDCKHWKPATHFDDDTDAIVVLEGLGFCMAVQGEAVQGDPDDTIANYNISRLGDRIAVPCDGSGYRAALLTRDRFGCVLFEPGKYER
jgi:hypothetical protein